MPKTKNNRKKRQFTVKIDNETPSSKKPCTDKQNRKRKTSIHEESPETNSRKKAKTQANKNDAYKNDDNSCIYTGTVSTVSCQCTMWPNLRYYHVNEEWQRQACNILGLEFIAVSNCDRGRGGPDTILTRPDCRSLKRILGDGNCLFRFLSYIITGSEQQHFELRTAIIYHMLSYPHLFIGNGADGLPNCITLHSHPRCYNSVEEYILQTRMDQETIWGTNVEMACLAHMLNSPVYCYDASQRHHIWAAYFPNNVDRSIPVDVGRRSLYIYFSNSHFQVVMTIRSR